MSVIEQSTPLLSTAKEDRHELRLGFGRSCSEWAGMAHLRLPQLPLNFVQLVHATSLMSDAQLPIRPGNNMACVANAIFYKQ